MRVERPSSASEAVAVLAIAGRLPVVIRGSGSRSSWQPPVDQNAVILETTGLSGAGELRPDNLSATFPAGITLTALQAQLRAAGLWFPVEHADAPDATLGGCLAAGFTNPLRLGYGAPRDWVLGLQVATPDGRLVGLGGEIIKNVAGYDLVKVHLGAWGRLGLITRATLRLLPLPEREQVLACEPGTAAEAAAAVQAALTSGARPAALELERTPEGRLRLTARLLGDADGLDRRAAALGAAWSPAGAGPAGTGAATLVPPPALAWRARLTLPAPGVAEALETLEHAMEGRPWSVTARAGNGSFTAWWADGAGPAVVLDHLRARIGSRGWVVPEGAAARAMAGKPDWVSFPPRSPRSQDRLEAAVRAALAPGAVLNAHLPEARP